MIYTSGKPYVISMKYGRNHYGSMIYLTQRGFAKISMGLLPINLNILPPSQGTQTNIYLRGHQSYPDEFEFSIIMQTSAMDEIRCCEFLNDAKYLANGNQ